MDNTNLSDIENTILQIYQNNLDYLKNNFFTLYKRILDFEEKDNFSYSLSFENSFELTDKEGNRTYNCDPFYDAKIRTKNLTENQSAFSVMQYDKKYKLNHQDLKIEASNLINQYIEIIDNNYIEASQKLIFLGTLLGVHINDISRQYDYKAYLIIEDNLEIFRLSLFLTDYTEVASKAKLFFCIEEENKVSTIEDFLDYLPQFNHQFKFEIASEKEIYLIEELSHLFISSNKINYPFSEYLLSFIRGNNYFKNYSTLLNLNENYSILNKQEILYLGAGLSLDKYIEFIKKNQENFLIVCVAATLKTLEKNNIIPDIIITSDSSSIILNQFEVDHKYYKNSIVFASNKTYPRVIELLNKRTLYFFNDSLELFSNTGINTGVNVGNSGYSLLLKLGAKNIYLLGFDACVNKKTGLTHSSKKNKTNFKEFDILKDDKIKSTSSLISVKGNFQKSVYTTNHFKLMVENLENLNKQFKPKAFNLSNGAFINGCSPKKIENLSLKRFIKDKNSLIKSFNTICKKSLDKDDKKILQENKNLIVLLKKLPLDENLYDNFKNVNRNNLILFKILNLYFTLINPFYNYSSNINNIKATKIYKNSFTDIINFIETNFTFGEEDE